MARHHVSVNGDPANGVCTMVLTPAPPGLRANPTLCESEAQKVADFLRATLPFPTMVVLLDLMKELDITQLL